jgi:MoaD family protein
VKVSVHFYSYFKDLTGCPETTEELTESSTIEELLRQLSNRFPKLATMKNSMLIAVGVDYQTRDHQLKDGDQVSLFPPVQGG